MVVVGATIRRNSMVVVGHYGQRGVESRNATVAVETRKNEITLIRGN